MLFMARRAAPTLVWALLAILAVQLSLGACFWIDPCCLYYSEAKYAAGEDDGVVESAETWLGVGEGAGVAVSAKVGATAKEGAMSKVSTKTQPVDAVDTGISGCSTAHYHSLRLSVLS